VLSPDQYTLEATGNNGGANDLETETSWTLHQ
jgi:hypothetical protein